MAEHSRGAASKTVGYAYAVDAGSRFIAVPSGCGDVARENGIFFVPGSRLRVPRGLLMYWETEPLEAEDKQ